MEKRKIYGTILGGIAFIAVIIAVTYARYAWQSSNTDLSFSISDSYFYCESGIESSVSSLSPVLDYRSGAVDSFWVNNIGMADTTFSISLNISSIDTSLKDKSFKYKIMLDSSGGSKNCASTSESGCTTVAEGNFEDAVVGMNTLADVVSLPNNSKYHYYLFIYIDGNMENSTAMQSSAMSYTIDVCEIVVFFDYNGGAGNRNFLKVTETYDGLPTATKGNTVISFNSNGGSSASSQTITHTFDGWYKDAVFTNKVNEDDEVTVTTNHTLHAKWNMTDTSGSNTSDGCITLPTPTRTGYTFKGWYKESSFTNLAGDAGANYCISRDDPARNITLYAKWQANSYTVNYYLGNGTSTAGATLIGTSTCVYDSECTLTTWATLGKTFPNSDHGWAFAGWSTATTGKSVNYENGYKFTTYTTANNINLYALGSRTFRFYSGVAPTSVLSSSKQYWNPYSTATSYLTSITVPSPTEIDGWEFIGYRANSTASASVTYSGATTTTPGAGSLTAFYFRSIYKRNLTITYNGNGNTGGSTGNTTEVQYYNSGYASDGANSGANVTKPSFTLAANGFTKTGYTFSKWADGSASGTQYDAGATYNTWGPAVTSTATSKTMYAIWNANTYNISYAMNGGTKGTGYPSSVKYDANAAVGLPSKSFTITGNVNSTGATIGNAVTGTYTFAGWTGTNINTSTAKYGTNASTVTTSWSNGSTKVKGTYYKNLTPTNGATVTMTANWNALTLTLPTVTKAGYTCNWNTKADGSGTDYASGGSYTAGATATTLAVTLYAECTANIYEVTLNNQSATSAGTTKVYYQYETTKTVNGVTCYYYTDSALTTCLSGGYTIVKPTKTGYSFNGYFTSTGGSGTQYVNASGGFINNVYKTIGNKTLYAHWVDDIAPSAPTFNAFYEDGTGNYTSGTWTNKQVHTTISSTDAGSGISKIQYITTDKDTTVDSNWTTFSFSVSSLSKSGTTWSGTEPWNLRDRNDSYYFRACDVAGNCSGLSSVYNIKYDITKPTTPTYTAFFTDGSGNYTSGNWTNKQVHTTISSTDAGSGIAKIQYILTNGDTTDDDNWTTFNFKISNLTQSGTTWTGTESWGLINRNNSYYFRACDYLNQCSEFATYTIKYDIDAPTCTLTSTATLKKATQTITASATNDTGGSNISKYYFGTSSTGTPSATTLPSMSASAAGTYYLRIQDGAGNIGSCNVVEHSYKVHNMLLTITGAKGTYTTANYDIASSSTYIAPKNTTLTLASIYTAPTGSSSSTFKGISTGVPSTTAATVSSTAPKLTANSNYGLWFDRTEYTITGKAGAGGTNKLVNQRSGTATASSGGSTTMAVRYGEKVTATATANTGYTFSGWSGLLSGTTNPSTTATLTSAGTITASFTDTKAPTCTISGNPTSWQKTDATLTVSGSDNSGSLHSSPYSWTSSSSGFGTTATKVVSANGTYTAYVKDAAGNVGSCKAEVTKIDKTAPTTPEIISMYDLYGSKTHSLSSHFSQNGDAFTTSGNDPYIMFNSIGNITGVTGAYIELTSNITSSHGQQIFYETSSTGFNEPHSNTETFASGTNKLYIPFTNTGEWAKVRYDFGSASGVTFNMKHLAVSATAAQWNADDIILRLSTTESGSGTSYWQYSYSSSASTTGTNADSTWVTYSSSASNTFIPSSYRIEGSKTIYVRACDAVGNCSSKASVTMKVDTTAPTCTLTSTSTLKATSQTITASAYSDGSGSGIAKYYFGTDSAGTPSSNTLPTMSANAAGTYYLRIQDNVGNIGSCSITMHSYKVHNMLLKTTGTKGTYNTSNYDTSSTVTYVAPKNTTLTLASIYTAPTGANSSTFKGVSTGAPSTTASTVSSTAPKLTANSTYGLWFDRIEYAISYDACSGSGAPAAQTKRYGVNLTLSSTTPTRTGYTFKGWGTACNSTAVYQPGGSYSTNAAATLYAIWSTNYTVTFYNSTGTTALGTQTVEKSVATALRTFSNLGGTVSNSSYGWSFAGWSTSTTATSKSHNDGASVTLSANLSLYAIYSRTLTFHSGVNKATNDGTRTQYYNTKSAGVSSVTAYTPATVTNWTALGYRDDTTTSSAEYTKAASMSPAATSSNNMYAVYSRDFTATFYSGTNKAKTDTASATAYYNTNTASTPTSANVTAPTPQSITDWSSLGWSTGTATTSASYAAGASVSSANTYYAVYSRSFTATFYSGVNKAKTDTASGTANYNTNTASLPTSANVTAPTPQSITDWSSLGWRANTTASTASYNAGASVSSANTYYAVYSRTFSSTFYSGVNKATTKSQASSAVYYNSNTASTPTSGNITPPTAATISNWTAIGWRTDTTATTNTAGTTGTVSSTNANYYAVYSRTLTISYNANGGSGTTAATTKTIYLNTNSTTTSSQAVTLATNNFTNGNSTFTKWALGSASGTQYAAGASYNPSLAYNTATFGKTMYALWEAPSVTVALNSIGGTIPATSGWSLTSQGTSYKSVSSGGTYGTLPTPTKSGFTFNNWKTGYAYGSISKSGTGTLTTTVLTGLHPGVTYKITMTSATATRSGYIGSAPTTFITQIYDSSSSTSLATISNSFGSNISYTIECPSDADANHTLELRIYTTGTTYTSVTTTYTGVNIYTDAFTSSSNVTSTTTVSATGNHMLFADWTEIQTYQVCYDANGGQNAPACQTKTHGVTLTLTDATPTKTGSTFKGWGTSTTATTPIQQPGGSYTINAGVTFYAIWEENTIVAALNPTGGTIGTATGWTKTSQGTAYKNVTTGSTYGSYYSQIPTPTRTNYTFNGWKTGYAYGSITKSGSGTLSETVLTGLHPGVTYKITMTNSTATRSGYFGTAPTTFYTQIYDASSSQSLATVSTSFGSNRSYTIECPSTADSSHTLELRIYTNSTTSSNISYTGVNIYTDTFTSSTTVTYSSTVTATGNHMLFADWTESGGGTTPTTYYTVTYSANGGSNAPAAQTKAAGATLTLTTDTPTRNTYIFRGWATTSTSTTIAYSPGDKYTADANITLYAIWYDATSLAYVYYDANGGSGAPATQSFIPGETITLSTTRPTRTNYTFQGWATTSTATTATYQPGASYTSRNTVTLYAVWSSTTTAAKNYGIASSCAPSSGSYTKYAETLADAISSATANQCITLLNSITDTSSVTFNKNLKFHTNGKKLTRSVTMIINSGITLTKEGTGTITSSDSVFTVNGNLTANAGLITSTGGHGIGNHGTGTVTINGATVNATSYSVMPNNSGTANACTWNIKSGLIYGHFGFSMYGNSKLNVSGGTIYGTTADQPAIYTNSGFTGTITISGGTIGSTSYNTYGIALPSGGKLNMTGGIINVGKGNAIINSGSGTVNISAATITAPATTLVNSGTGIMNIGTTTASAYHTAKIVTTGTGYPTLACGNSSSGSKAHCALYKGASLQMESGYAVSNYNADFRMFSGAYIGCGSSSTDYYCIQNIGTTYSTVSSCNFDTTNGCFYGRIFIRQGYANGGKAVVYSKVKNVEGVHIGYRTDTLYALSDYQSYGGTDASKGPVLHSTIRGVYLDNTGTSWVFDNGLVGGVTAYSNQTATTTRSNHTIGNSDYNGYKWGYLNPA